MANCKSDLNDAKDAFAKVNGKDISPNNLKETVQMFENTSDPIMIEVLRRNGSTQQKTLSPAIDKKSTSPAATNTTSPMITIATQTDEYDDDDIYYIEDNELGDYDLNADETGSQQFEDLPLTELDLATGLDCEEEAFNKTLDFEYEEIVLHRNSIDQKVGLTLCYGSTYDEITDVYIREIDPAGVAGRDGRRIREGDQILQINGFDVHTRQQAVRMFAESQSTITLLLARPAAQMDDGFMEVYNSLDDLSNQLDGMASCDHGLQSGRQHQIQKTVGTDISCAEKSQSDIYKKTSKYSEDKIFNNKQNDILTSLARKVTEELPSFDLSRRLPAVPPNSTPSNCLASTTEAVSIESEIAALNREMQRIQLQYHNIVNAHKVDQNGLPLCQAVAQPIPSSDMMIGPDTFRSPRKTVPRMGTRIDQLRHGQEGSEHQPRLTQQHPCWVEALHRSPTRWPVVVEQDSSAYNTGTGESCRSTPGLALELLPGTDETKSSECSPLLRLASHSDLEQNGAGFLADGAQKEWSSDGDARDTSVSGVVARASQTRDDNNVESLQALYTQYVDVMYTNKANLQHTIMVQQNLFQQQIAKKMAAATTAPSSTQNTSSSPAKQPAPPSNQPTKPGVQMEWVVKRRADGSRYITRRPVRNRILKERARKVAEERCGLTTDDDAVSEMKVGRYWSKEERKQHLEKAREHRRQKELLLRQLMENTKDAAKEARKEANVTDVNRKHVRHKGKKAIDDFTSVQELLVHGSRDIHGKSHNALLSVTTV